ncbi:MAG: sugar phosphate isomerase/epimerase [Betaproteobacteria bacterium]
MKIGMITDSLPEADFDTMLAVAARLDMDMLEFGCGNWSQAPHLKLDELLESVTARREFLARLAAHDITISALNCSGNPVHPGAEGRRHADVTQKTIRLAGLLGIERVVMMSGCPGAPGDSHANWITTEWPAEVRDILRWQWDEVLIPYWSDLVVQANAHGVGRLCLELHGYQNVYNVRTLKRLRDAVGDTIGANLDPSHLMWMGADPIAAAHALGDAIYYVHAKDTRIDPVIAGINGIIDTTPGSDFRHRAWSYITLGHGHADAWWSDFMEALESAGYDGVLSIEHEDPAMSAEAGVAESVALLRRVLDGRAARKTRPAQSPDPASMASGGDRLR